MGTDLSLRLPRRVVVKEVINSRYDSIDLANQIESDGWFNDSTRKPLSWDLRREGIDTIKTEDDIVMKLNSDGGQSVPDVGWVILLTAGDDDSGYSWTLYGLPKKPH